MTDSVESGDVRRRAGWLPTKQDHFEAWLAGHCDRVAGRDQPLARHPVVTEFQDLIDSDPVVRMYVTRMIEQVPQSREYRKRHLHGVGHMLDLINEVLAMAPEFGEESMVATPIGAILDWTMGTPAGFAAYRDSRINTMLKKILNVWCEFLDSPASRYVLNDSPNGWTSQAARRAIGIEQYEYNPEDAHWGFASWNDFFTRRFRDGQRPVADPGDDAVIVNACESTPYAIATDVQRTSQFWIKEQPYSLKDVLAGDPCVEQFMGGTVYQAFLSATDYHRWHSPVSGTIVRAFRQQGTYFSEADSEGSDAVEPTHSQAYLAHVATRAVILIEADNPAIGLIAGVFVGMSDVSSCCIHSHLTPGQRVVKGEELGFFQYGGSTYCLVLRPDAIANFAVAALPQPHNSRPPLVHVGSRLARAPS